MRMGNSFVGGSRIRLQGDTAIGLTAGQTTNVEPDLKGTEVHIVQDDRIGRDGNRAFRQVDLDFPELILNRHNLVKNLRLGREMFWTCLLQLVSELHQTLAATLHLAREVLREVPDCRRPSTVSSNFNQPQKPVQAVTEPIGEGGTAR